MRSVGDGMKLEHKELESLKNYYRTERMDEIA